jgi:hypothetical protein
VYKVLLRLLFFCLYFLCRVERFGKMSKSEMFTKFSIDERFEVNTYNLEVLNVEVEKE